MAVHPYQRLQMHWDESADTDHSYPPAETLFALLESNPFAPIQEMDSDDWRAWRPYDRAAAVSAMQEYRIVGVDLRSAAPFLLSGGVHRRSFQNNVNLYVSDALMQETDLEAILQVMRQVASALPRFLEASFGVTWNVRAFQDEHNLPNLPAFNLCLHWAQIVSPRGIAPYYLPEDLLQAPAYRVQQLENGLIEMLVYPHPLEYQLPENLQRYIELTRYFAAKRRR